MLLEQVTIFSGKQKGLTTICCKPLFYMVALEGLEPATKRL